MPTDDSPVRALLLDIEGTTTPIEFVTRTLFPYARRQFQEFLLRHANDLAVREDIKGLRKQHAADLAQDLKPPAWLGKISDADVASAISYAQWLMDRDAKYASLKSLQGKIWQEGYQQGELRGEVFPDVPVALARWSRQRKAVCIFSSGSVLAQKLLLSTTLTGDLTRFIRAYFDTATGAKTDAQSYLRIAGSLSLEPQEILFISDVSRELDGARQAGMQTALCVRDKFSDSHEHNYRVIRTFDNVFP